MNTTVRLKASDITKDWHVIDAAGRPLGRVASEAAVLLRGKHKPSFEPHLDGGDFVIIVNASQVRVTGRKSEQINYYSHSGYPGGLKTRPYAVQLARFPERILEQAVWGMLPKGPLGKKIMKHLKVYKGPKHPHESQIVGSDRARAARETALAESLVEPMKAPRLRPLSVAQVVAEEAATAPTKAAAPKAKPAAAPRTRAKAPATEAPAPTAAGASAAAAVPEPAPAAETAAPPKRRTAAKADEGQAPIVTPTAEEAPAPKRTRAKAAEAPAAEAAAAKAPRKTAAAQAAPGEEEAAPKRRTRAKAAESTDAPAKPAGEE